MDNRNKATLLGVLWGIVCGIPALVVGGSIGFALFGLVLFADTAKAEMLIGGSALVSFLMVFFVTLFYWRKKKVLTGKESFIFPCALIMVEIFCALGILFWLNTNSARMYPSDGVITDTTLERIFTLPVGTYHVVAKVKENSLVCGRSPKGIMESCFETGRLILTEEQSGNDLPVYPQLPMGRVNELSAGRTYYFTIEKSADAESTIYSMPDFKPIS